MRRLGRAVAGDRLGRVAWLTGDGNPVVVAAGPRELRVGTGAAIPFLPAAHSDLAARNRTASPPRI